MLGWPTGHAAYADNSATVSTLGVLGKSNSEVDVDEAERSNYEVDVDEAEKSNYEVDVDEAEKSNSEVDHARRLPGKLRSR